MPGVRTDVYLGFVDEGPLKSVSPIGRLAMFYGCLRFVSRASGRTPISDPGLGGRTRAVSHRFWILRPRQVLPVLCGAGRLCWDAQCKRLSCDRYVRGGDRCVDGVIVSL